MNLDSLSLSLFHLENLVENLSKKNYKYSVQEINQLVEVLGVEAEIHLISCLFCHVPLECERGSAASWRENPQLQLLHQLCSQLVTRSNFVRVISHVIQHPNFQQKYGVAQLLSSLSRVLKLNRSEEVAFAIALLHAPDAQCRQHAQTFVQQKLPDLIRGYIDSADSSGATDEGGLHESSPELLHQLVSWLLYAPPDQLDKAADSQEAFLEAIRKDFPRELVPVVLAPLIYQEHSDLPLQKLNTVCTMTNSMLDGCLAEFVLEAGYSLCVSADECRRQLSAHGTSQLTAPCVARVLGAMVRTHTGHSAAGSCHPRLGSAWDAATTTSTGADADSETLHTWNVDVFVRCVHELAPALQWKEVVYNLDYTGFQVLDRGGLQLLTAALQLGLQLQLGCSDDHFPVDLLVRPWRNGDAQLAYLSQILKNADIFCLADFQCHLVDVSQLKVVPDKDNKEISNWRCTELGQVLMQLADSGHLGVVQELLKFPVQNCPDLLLLTLLSGSCFTHLAHELITNLLFVFLAGHHPNSSAVLHQAWNWSSCTGTGVGAVTVAGGVHGMVAHAMAQWHRQADGDQTRLSRILDVVQDLKGLSLLLSGQSLPFVIDLACLASRREYLKLDKWMSDKIQEHGEPFITAVVKFLQRRVPQLSSGPLKEAESVSSPLPAALVASILNVLHARVTAPSAGRLSAEMVDSVLTLVSHGNQLLLLGRQRQQQPPQLVQTLAPPPGVVRPAARALETAFGTVPLSVQLYGSQTGGTGTSSGHSEDQLVSGLAAGVGGLALSSSAAAPGLLTNSVSGNAHPSTTLSSGYGTMPGVLGPSVSSRAIGQCPPQQHSLVTAPLASSQSMTSASFVIGSSAHSQSRPASQANDMTQLGQPAQIDAATLSREVEEEANSNFQRIYNHPPHPTLSISEVLDMLKRFQDSSVPREREVFICMLRSLMEEYKFFPQYPDKELYITAQLFGGIIEHNLVTNYRGLGIALRYVLDAVKKPPGSKMYNFGVVALDRFRLRLREYPQYCRHLTNVEHFNQLPKHLIECIECGVSSQEPLARSEGALWPSSLMSSFESSVAADSSTSPAPCQQPASVSSASSAVSTASVRLTSGRPSIANTTNIDTLVNALQEVVAPADAIQDKISFIFNNLSQINLQQKREDLLEVLEKEYWLWFAQYLVMRRVSIEPNFHTLYANFLDSLKLPDLLLLVVRELHRNIQVLLRADKGVEKFNDRTILKNLGHWLGLMTIAKNKPVLQVDIDIKSLIVEAYHLGVHELLYIVPFVAKVLESCAKSKIFRPPNPWTMGIMNLFAELHREDGLKLNLKFEIEVLCKTLSLEVTELKPTNWLKDHARLQTLPMQLKRPLPPVVAPVLPPPAMMSASVRSTPGSAMFLAAGVDDRLLAASSVSSLPLHHQAPPPSTMPPQPPPPAPAQPPPSLALDTGLTRSAEPRFSLADINTATVAALAPHIIINQTLPLFQSHPQLRQLVRPAVERSVHDWLARSVERYYKLAVSTVEQIIKKDFAMDPDEAKMRLASHQMVVNLSAGLTLINCRHPLQLALGASLKSALMTAARTAAQQHKEQVDQTASVVAADNVELACCFVQKTAVEKAISELDKRLAPEYEARKCARAEGSCFVDGQESRLPEPLRLKPVTDRQMAVFEEFVRVVPGFAPGSSVAVSSASGAGVDVTQLAPNTLLSSSGLRVGQPPPVRATAPPSMASSGDEMSSILDKLAAELQGAVQLLSAAALTSQHGRQLARLADDVTVARGARDSASHVHLVKLAVDGLLEYLAHVPSDPELALKFRDAHLFVLRALQDPRVHGPLWVQKQVTSFIVEGREDFRLTAGAVDALLRARLISLSQLDSHLANAIDAGVYSVIGLAMQLLQAFLIDERNSQLSEADFANTIESLSKLLQQPGCPDNISHLLELVRDSAASGTTTSVSSANTLSTGEMALSVDRTPGGPTAHIHKGISQARDFDDPPGMQEKTEYLLREWVSLYHSPGSGRDSTKAFTNIVHQMNLQGILKTDDLITRFFRLCTQLCVDLCYRALNDPAAGSPTMIRNKCFRTLDAFVRLIALLVKHSGESPHAVSKINLLNKVLGIVTGVLLQDHEVRKSEFQQLSYHRVLIMLLLELNAPEPELETINFQVLTAFCNVLHILRPEKAPGFAYAWLDVVSHRVFIGRMLAVTPQHKGWGPYAQLLIDLFHFLSPFLRNAELARPIAVLYKGCLRVLLVLLHDFPEFLCDYHYNFCDAIPPNCIQMRNLILSAFPRVVPPPDPFASKLQVDMIPEIRDAPMIQTNFASLIQPPMFKNELDTYLSTRAPVTFVTDLRTTLQHNPDQGCRYSIKLINALVLYVGTQAIALIQSKGLQPNKQTIAHSAHMDIFQSLAVDLDTEGRYLFLNAIANQLRYPNSHTNYFLNLILYLFAEANTLAIQEQITRVLLERLIVNRPHPWGLLITFIELIKNPTFKFWSYEFVHCAPEIEKLFENVARSCVSQGQKVASLRATASASSQQNSPGVTTAIEQ